MTDIEDIDSEYDLEVLLELRSNERDEAERRYREAMDRKRALEQEVKALTERRSEMIKDRKRQCRKFDDRLADGGCTMDQIQKFDRYVSGLCQREEEMSARIQKKRGQCRRARRNMERAHDEMIDAVRKLKAVEKHYQQWKEDREAVEQRRQSAKMDDVAARMWRKNQ